MQRSSIACLALVALAILPALANGAANISDPVGDTVRRGPGATDLIAVHAFSDETTLELTVTYAAPPRSERLSLVSSSHSLAQLDPSVRRCDPRASDRLTITAPGDGVASLRVHHFPMAVRAVVERPSPVVRVYRFRSPLLNTGEAFVAQACLSGQADGDRFYGPWEGRTLKLTPALARSTVLQHLRARFGQSIGTAARDWLACPHQQAFEPGGDYWAGSDCQFDLRIGPGRFVSGTATALLADSQPALGDLMIRRVTRQSRRCPIRASTTVRGVVIRRRSVVATRTFRCLLHEPPPIEAIDVRASGRSVRRLGYGFPVFIYGGTQTRGFDRKYRFSCRDRRHGIRQVVKCRNRLGDALVYRFEVEPS